MYFRNFLIHIYPIPLYGTKTTTFLHFYVSFHPNLHVSYFSTVPPQIQPFDFGDDVINFDEMATLTCSVTKGDFPIDIIWTFNGKPIRSSDGINIAKISKRMSSLSIEAAQDYHSGEYKCIARNKAGEASHTAALKING